MKTYKKNNKGFTLIELLIVISVIGILAAISVTAYVGSTLKASRSEAYSNLTALRMFEEQRFSEVGAFSANPADFPGFGPWAAGVFTEYAYNIVGLGIALPAAPSVPYNGATVGQAGCFVITATGTPGTRVAGDIFAIDCNGTTNF